MPIQIVVSLVFVLCLIGLVAYLAKYAKRKLRTLRPQAMHVKEAYGIDGKHRLVVLEHGRTEYTLVLGSGTPLLLSTKPSFQQAISHEKTDA